MSGLGTRLSIDDALRTLDPAPGTTLTDDERRRAIADRDRIVAMPVAGPPATGGARSRSPRRWRRWAPAVLVVAVTAVAVPLTVGGEPALASWSATPTALSTDEAETAVHTCASISQIEGSDVDLLLGERRGGWTYVLISGASGHGACLMPDEAVGADGTDASTTGVFASSETGAEDPPTPARDSIIETESAGGAIAPSGWLPLGQHDEWFSSVSGVAGEEVHAITVHPPVGPDVTASLRNGRYAAWWPAGRAGGGQPGVSGAWSYTVTLADGTTRDVPADR